MFDQTFVNSGGTTGKPWALGLSFLFQVTSVAAVVLASMVFFEALPMARLSSYLVAPPPPLSRADVRPVAARTSPSPRRSSVLFTPTRIPPAVAIIDDADLPAADAMPGSIPSGLSTDAGSSALNLLGPIPTIAPKPVVEPKPTTPPPSKPVPVGGDVQAANLIRKVMPVYPPPARQARISGKVRFAAIIGRDGTIQNLQLIEGHPFLVKAAQDAIKQWLYRPTMLNGQPVEVITQIEVNFTLG